MRVVQTSGPMKIAADRDRLKGECSISSGRVAGGRARSATRLQHESIITTCCAQMNGAEAVAVTVCRRLSSNDTDRTWNPTGSGSREISLGLLQSDCVLVKAVNESPSAPSQRYQRDDLSI